MNTKLIKLYKGFYFEELIKITNNINIGLMDTSALGNTNASEIFIFISAKINNKLKQDSWLFLYSQLSIYSWIFMIIFLSNA